MRLLNGVKLIGEEAPRKLQELARHQLIVKLYADILVDMQICEIEGWDKLELVRMLQDLLNGLGNSNGQ